MVNWLITYVPTQRWTTIPRTIWPQIYNVEHNACTQTQPRPQSRDVWNLDNKRENQLPRADLTLSIPAGGGTAPGLAPLKTSRHASKSRCTAAAAAGAAIVVWGAPAPRRGRLCRRRRIAPPPVDADVLLPSSSGTPQLASTCINTTLAPSRAAASRECEGLEEGRGGRRVLHDSC